MDLLARTEIAYTQTMYKASTEQQIIPYRDILSPNGEVLNFLPRTDWINIFVECYDRLNKDQQRVLERRLRVDPMSPSQLRKLLT